MTCLNPLLLFFVFLLTGLEMQVSKPNSIKWVITKECFLKVSGSTNINKFNCEIANYYNPDTLTIYRNNDTAVKVTGALEVDVENFNCHNPIMTKDLRSTLKANQFPKLIIRFLSLSKYPDGKNQEEIVKGIVSIELAGVTKRFNIDYRFILKDANSLVLIGTKEMKFTDFNIIPPRKLGGMIYTNNELNIQFNLNVKILN